jgi:hypothetical protein
MHVPEMAQDWRIYFATATRRKATGRVELLNCEILEGAIYEKVDK